MPHEATPISDPNRLSSGPGEEIAVASRYNSSYIRTYWARNHSASITVGICAMRSLPVGLTANIGRLGRALRFRPYLAPTWFWAALNIIGSAPQCGTVVLTCRALR